MNLDIWCLQHILTIIDWYIDGLVQDCSNTIAITLQLLQSCTKPSISCTVEQFQHCEKCYCIAVVCSVEVSTVATDSVFNIDRINTVRIALEELLLLVTRFPRQWYLGELFLCHNYVEKYSPCFFLDGSECMPSKIFHNISETQYTFNSTMTNILQRLPLWSKHISAQLAYWGRDKMASISLSTFWSALSSVKTFDF